MSFPDVAKAGSAMKSVFGILDARSAASQKGEGLLWHRNTLLRHACLGACSLRVTRVLRLVREL